jgi:hypothetical protein
VLLSLRKPFTWSEYNPDRLLQGQRAVVKQLIDPSAWKVDSPTFERGRYRPSLLEQTDPHQAALKNTIADAPTTTRTKTNTRMAGSSTTSSALPVVVACISRIPTVAR